jgi:hypothetical protein
MSGAIQKGANSFLETMEHQAVCHRAFRIDLSLKQWKIALALARGHALRLAVGVITPAQPRTTPLLKVKSKRPPRLRRSLPFHEGLHIRGVPTKM